MSRRDESSKDDLFRLIDESSIEDDAAIEPEAAKLASPASKEPPEPLINHPVAIVLAWAVGLIFAIQPLVNPILPEHDLETRPRLKVLGTEMYHEAHRIETYHRITGRFPDYLNEAFDEFEISWDTSGDLEYQKQPNGYSITGRLEGLELVYRHGDDPEVLLHDPAIYARPDQ